MYASIDDCKRAQQLDVLLNQINGYLEPCLLMGDFNDLLYESENEGDNIRTAASMRIFRNFVTQARLLDLG